ncbi:MAG TPA: hypothetical protein VKI61_14815, partial [Chitinophagaceae bacterium]|nr:hypothetical protein [Chitinophagaceae bacterium]
ENDSLITLQYHTIANGKWNHMMSQTHIGYTYWQQPNVQKMPEVKYIAIDTTVEKTKTVMVQDIKLESIEADSGPEDKNINIFHETDGYVSIEAADFTKAINTGNIKWKVLPDLGRTGSAVTSFPVTSSNQKPGAGSPQLQYEFYSYDCGSIKLQAYFSPSLNFNNDEGLKYAVSIDNETPQIVVLNKEDNQQKIWARWVADNIIIKTTEHIISQPGKHVLHYWMVTPAVVLQKLVFDLGGLKESYLGPPETRH